LNEQEIAESGNHLAARKIPGYWHTCLNNSGIVKESIGKDDDNLMKAIESITVVDEEGSDNFTIVFEMAENGYISNKVLTKKFYLKNNEPVKCEASPIEWTGKNLTLK
jgi:hypothetical protein